VLPRRQPGPRTNIKMGQAERVTVGRHPAAGVPGLTRRTETRVKASNRRRFGRRGDVNNG
jgi:hypothetical protein